MFCVLEGFPHRYIIEQGSLQRSIEHTQALPVLSTAWNFFTCMCYSEVLFLVDLFKVSPFFHNFPVFQKYPCSSPVLIDWLGLLFRPFGVGPPGSPRFP